MIEVGQKASLTKIIDSDDLHHFAALSMDDNPIHLDEAYADENSLWRKRIAHGSYVASFISAVLGTKLPGPGAIYLSQDLSFRGPAFIGDEITAEVELLEIGRKRVATFSTCCRNQHGDEVITGTAKIKLPSC